jgi:hypothetical protein
MPFSNTIEPVDFNDKDNLEWIAKNLSKKR